MTIHSQSRRLICPFRQWWAQLWKVGVHLWDLRRHPDLAGEVYSSTSNSLEVYNFRWEQGGPTESREILESLWLHPELDPGPKEFHPLNITSIL